jgi:hypothetical protein
LDSFLIDKYQAGMISQDEVITKSQDPATILHKLQELQSSQASAEGQAPAA